MKKANLIYFGSFLILLLVSLWPILKQFGAITPHWDWNIPYYQEQFLNQFKTQLNLWEEKSNGGYFYQFRGELPYWLIILPFSFLPGGMSGKIFPLILIVIAYWSMFLMVQKLFKLKPFWSFLAASFYALSPFVYSRFVAGHLTMILVYALIPLIPLGLMRFSRKNGLYLILLFPFFFAHLNMAVLSLIIFLVFLFSSIMEDKRRLIKMIPFGLGLVLITCYLWLPSMKNLFSNQPFFFKEAALISNLDQQKENIRQGSVSIFKLAKLGLPQNLYTEFVYPWPWPKIGAGMAVLFFLTALAGLVAGRQERAVRPFSFLFLLGLFASNGTTNPIGRLFFNLLSVINPVLSAGFDNPPRFLPVYFLGLISVVFFFLNKLETQTNSILTARFLKISFLVGLFFLLSPWWSGGLGRPVYPESYLPLSLSSQLAPAQNRQIFDFLKQNAQDYRVAYFPSINISPPTKNETLLRCQGQFPPQPYFFASLHPDLTKRTILQFFSPFGSQKLASLLAMGSVKFLVWEEINPLRLYQDLNFLGTDTNYQSILKENLNQLTEVDSFEKAAIYQVANPYSMVYIPQKVIIADQPDNSLVALLENGFIDDMTLILDQEAKEERADFLALYGDFPSPWENTAQFSLNVGEAGEYQLFFKKTESSWQKLPGQNLETGKEQVEAFFDKSANLVGLWQKYDSNTHCAAIAAKGEYQAYRLLGNYHFSGERAHLVIAKGEPGDNLSQEKIIFAEDLVSSDQETAMDFGFSLNEQNGPFRICLVNYDNNDQLKINSLGVFFFYQPELLAIKTNTALTKNRPQLTFEKINTSQYLVNIEDAKEPFFLVLNQSFHSGWQVNQNGKSLSAKHYRANTFANTWLIEETGSYQLTIEFLPQKTYRVGLFISAAALLLIFLLTIRDRGKTASLKRFG
ncbi:MAG: hypothetical protein PHU92_02915 [Candidatus Shapirobacteria bacterium]|nr:hypothetical protein [Candidatus Shapirobacteria bacterium]